MIVELPDHRRAAIHPLDPDDELDSLVDELLDSNKAFRDLLTKSAVAPRRPFVPGEEP